MFELMDCNIYELIRGRRHRLPESLVKMYAALSTFCPPLVLTIATLFRYTYQLVKAMDHMHRNGIFHRDIKPENILIMDDLLKLADFGSCRGIYSKQPYTEYISTRWYRAPECLLTDGCYGYVVGYVSRVDIAIPPRATPDTQSLSRRYKMDMWGVGCVLFEILALYPLFPGTDEKDQIERIHAIIGTPPSEVLAKFQRYSSHIDYKFPPQKGCGIQSKLPHASPEAVDIIVKLLAYDPEDRISARQALRHPWFQELRAADKRQQHANGSRSQPTGRSSARTNGATGGSSSKSGATKGSGAPSAAASTGAADGGDTGQGGGKSEEKQAEHSGTTGSDPGLPTIGKGSKVRRGLRGSVLAAPCAGLTNGPAQSKRGNQNSSTIALPVPASSTGTSNTKGHHGHHGHHSHHHNRHGPGTNSSAVRWRLGASFAPSTTTNDHGCAALHSSCLELSPALCLAQARHRMRRCPPLASLFTAPHCAWVGSTSTTTSTTASTLAPRARTPRKARSTC